MNTKLKTIGLGLCLSLLAACNTGIGDIEEPIYNTNHPEEGYILRLLVNWDDRTVGVPVPESYTFQSVPHEELIKTTYDPAEIHFLFTPGPYRFQLYTEAENISVSGTTATADYFNNDELLGYFFSAAKSFNLEADTDHTFSMDMQQQVRDLTIVLTPTGGTIDRIAGIDATLNGVAGAINIDDNSVVGDPVSIKPLFKQVMLEDGGIEYRANLRLLDIAGAGQTLDLNVTFIGNMPTLLHRTCVLTSQLTGFGQHKREPLTVTSTFETPYEAGFGGEVDKWDPGYGNGNAD